MMPLDFQVQHFLVKRDSTTCRQEFSIFVWECASLKLELHYDLRKRKNLGCKRQSKFILRLDFAYSALSHLVNSKYFKLYLPVRLEFSVGSPRTLTHIKQKKSCYCKLCSASAISLLYALEQVLLGSHGFLMVFMLLLLCSAVSFMGLNCEVCCKEFSCWGRKWMVLELVTSCPTSLHIAEER